MDEISGKPIDLARAQIFRQPAPIFFEIWNGAPNWAKISAPRNDSQNSAKLKDLRLKKIRATIRATIRASIRASIRATIRATIRASGQKFRATIRASGQKIRATIFYFTKFGQQFNKIKRFTTKKIRATIRASGQKFRATIRATFSRPFYFLWRRAGNTCPPQARTSLRRGGQDMSTSGSNFAKRKRTTHADLKLQLRQEEAGNTDPQKRHKSLQDGFQNAFEQLWPAAPWPQLN